jgi:hypothetical protein
MCRTRTNTRSTEWAAALRSRDSIGRDPLGSTRQQLSDVRSALRDHGSGHYDQTPTHGYDLLGRIL